MEVSSPFDDAMHEVVKAEVTRRYRAEEKILELALASGMKTVEMTWPDDLAMGRSLYELPSKRRERRRLLKIAEDARHG